MAQVTIHIQESDILNVRHMLDGLKKSGDQVFARALNKTPTGVKTDASAEIRKELNVTKKVVDSTFRIEKASLGKMSCSIWSTDKPLPLIGFIGTKQTKKGVSVLIKKGRARTVIPKTFMATMKSGHKGVFWREKVGGKLVRRLPISERFSSRVPDILENEPVMTEVLKKAGERLHTNIDHELNYELSKLK